MRESDITTPKEQYQGNTNLSQLPNQTRAQRKRVATGKKKTRSPVDAAVLVPTHDLTALF